MFPQRCILKMVTKFGNVSTCIFTELPARVSPVYKEVNMSHPEIFVLHLYAGALHVSVRIRPRSCFCWLKTIT